jgi:hypothetical protein
LFLCVKPEPVQDDMARPNKAHLEIETAPQVAFGGEVVRDIRRLAKGSPGREPWPGGRKSAHTKLTGVTD